MTGCSRWLVGVSTLPWFRVNVTDPSPVTVVHCGGLQLSAAVLSAAMAGAAADMTAIAVANPTVSAFFNAVSWQAVLAGWQYVQVCPTGGLIV
ncbi:hypothetical protein Atai01_59180 [Amycolatopsis taiwanensis]|uniref:Uncharacterized protein n=1 Tax=Amycolatopsis taiwanensis TaxID=342230 RepID=A0A9W6R558_9PSEU|nr:hypothetical protein Atai01_59180 [Amycolatopsis taiwanensis]